MQLQRTHCVAFKYNPSLENIHINSTPHERETRIYCRAATLYPLSVLYYDVTVCTNTQHRFYRSSCAQSQVDNSQEYTSSKHHTFLRLFVTLSFEVREESHNKSLYILKSIYVRKNCCFVSAPYSRKCTMEETDSERVRAEAVVNGLRSRLKPDHREAVVAAGVSIYLNLLHES